VKEISRPVLEFAREMLTELLDFDGRMLLSMRLLLTRPGFLSHEYINDRRLSYTSPIRMYLVISLVFFFALPLILPVASFTSPDHKVSVDLYSRAMFLLLPLFALFLKILYRQSYYVAHLVFTIHLFGAMYIVFAIMMSFESLADRYLLIAALQVVFWFTCCGISLQHCIRPTGRAGSGRHGNSWRCYCFSCPCWEEPLNGRATRVNENRYYTTVWPVRLKPVNRSGIA
jgi:hypothetical protein